MEQGPRQGQLLSLKEEKSLRKKHQVLKKKNFKSCKWVEKGVNGQGKKKKKGKKKGN